MKHAFRSLTKSPGFAAIAILTLGMGIGANTAMFSVLNTLLFQRATYPSADRVVRLFRATPQAQNMPHSLPDLRDFRAQNDVFESLTAYCGWTYSLAEPGQPAQTLPGAIASADLFSTLGLQPMLGRGFTAEEQEPGRDRVAVISHDFWQRYFASDRNVVGRTLRIDGQNIDVIGVMPAGASQPIFWGRVDIWRPLPLVMDWRENRDTRWLNALGRLKPGVSREHAQIEMDSLATRLAQQFPETNAGSSLRLAPLRGSAMDDVGRNLTWLTLGLAGLVLLIACANVANLQLARSAARSRDFAIRSALGASRGRLIGQLMTESTLVALAGGALGLLLAQTITDALAPALLVAGEGPTTFPLDLRVLGFALLASVLTGTLSGSIPAWLASKIEVNGGLKQHSRGSTGDRSRHRLRHTLIVVQIAFSLVLLAGAGFFVRGLQRFMERDPGWQTKGLVAGTITLPETRYSTPTARRNFHDRLLQRIAPLPGVQHVALASALPIENFDTPTGIVIEGRPPPPRGQEPLASHFFVSPDFFTTLGIQLVEGRLFPASIRVGDPAVVVINDTFARQFWPGDSAIGKRIRTSDPQDQTWKEVIGVVRDVALAGNFSPPNTSLQIYRPMVHEPWGFAHIVVRATAPETLAEPLRRAVAELDADLPVAYLRTVETWVNETQQNFRVANTLLLAFAGIGLVLAAIGLYGVVSGLVVQRTPEFGIRLALGAQPRQVLGLVLGKGGLLAGLGIALGLFGAMGLFQVLSALIPGLPGQDAIGLAAVIGLLLAITLFATWLPARRAAKVDPIIALRAE